MIYKNKKYCHQGGTRVAKSLVKLTISDVQQPVRDLTMSLQYSNPSTLPDEPAEILAVVLPDGTPEHPDALTDFVATGTMLLVRHSDGRMALEPVRHHRSVGRSAPSSGSKSRSRPILDPVSREIMGYEMELPVTATI